MIERIRKAAKEADNMIELQEVGYTGWKQPKKRSWYYWFMVFLSNP